MRVYTRVGACLAHPGIRMHVLLQAGPAVWGARGRVAFLHSPAPALPDGRRRHETWPRSLPGHHEAQGPALQGPPGPEAFFTRGRAASYRGSRLPCYLYSPYNPLRWRQHPATRSSGGFWPSWRSWGMKAGRLWPFSWAGQPPPRDAACRRGRGATVGGRWPGAGPGASPTGCAFGLLCLSFSGCESR